MMVIESKKHEIVSLRRLKMSMCRACLVLLSESDIMHDLVKDKNLAIKYLECTSILVLDTEDDMPKCICSSCYQLLDKFYDFQRMCAESMLNFKKLLEEAEMQQKRQKAAKCMISEEEEEYAAELALTLESCIDDVDINKSDIDDACPRTADRTSQSSSVDVEDDGTEEHSNGTTAASGNDHCQSSSTGEYTKLVCHICTQGFYKPSLLEAHLRKHRGLKPYFCTTCHKSYERKQKLEEHIASTHQQKVYNCPIDDCQKVYKAPCTLRSHIAKIHNGDQQDSAAESASIIAKQCVCEVCGKIFACKERLERHRYVHLSKDERPFACTHCDYRFYTKQLLLNHLNRHTGDNPYKCDKCSRALPSRAALTTHIDSAHKTRGRWYCAPCNRTYLNGGNLRKHEQAVHLRVRRFVCRHCGERFARRHHLKDHEMRHTGERPFTCEFCQKGFIQRSSLKTHVLKMHPTDAKLTLN